MKAIASNNRKGFTLVEILVVMAIIAALMSISFVAFNAVVKNTREKNTKLRIDAIEASLADYLDDRTNVLPAGDGGTNSTTVAAGAADAADGLYEILTGDWNRNWKIDDDEVGRMVELVPTVFTDEAKTIPDVQSSFVHVDKDGVLYDDFTQPLRYYHDVANNRGAKNYFEKGYDLWSGGQDQKTTGDSTDTDDTMRDDLKNW